MTGITEVKVGGFVVGAVALLAVAWTWTYDGVRPSEAAYAVSTRLPTADGLWVGTPVRLAGVEVGSVASIEVSGREAVLELLIRERYPLPADSIVEIRSSGMLGDRFVVILPGRAQVAVEDGGRLEAGDDPMDIDAIGREAQGVATEVRASVARLSDILEREQNVRNLEESLANLAELTATLGALATRNQHEMDQVVHNLARITDNVDALVSSSSPMVTGQLTELERATTTLNEVLGDLSSITDRIERGEGSLGALVNERDLVDQLDRTLVSTDQTMRQVGGLLGGDSDTRMRADAWTTGRLFVGAAGEVRTAGTVGAELGPSEDMWLTAEVVVPPSTEAISPRLSLLLNQRVGPASVHAGMKEGSEGLGAALHLGQDRLRLQADAFDFSARHAARRPGLPNLRVGLRAAPVRPLWVEVAGEELLWGLDNGTPSAWLGVGVHLAE